MEVLLTWPVQGGIGTPRRKSHWHFLSRAIVLLPKAPTPIYSFRKLLSNPQPPADTAESTACVRNRVEELQGPPAAPVIPALFASPLHTLTLVSYVAKEKTVTPNTQGPPGVGTAFHTHLLLLREDADTVLDRPFSVKLNKLGGYGSVVEPTQHCQGSGFCSQHRQTNKNEKRFLSLLMPDL